MEKQKKEISWRRKVGKILIMIFCAAVTSIVVSVLLFVYKPDQNALGALGSVCMDVFCMMVLMIFVASIAFDRDEISITTKLFWGLMVGTLYALFFDFLTWSLDGSLSFGGWTNLFINASLFSGSILAAVFVLYLSSYLNEMHNLKTASIRAKICVIFNVFSFILTMVLAFSGKAYNIVDGHYVTGPFYDYIVIIPVLSLIYMTGYTARNVKTVGLHDLIAVAGYIFLMICGALIEEIYSIGTTYVSVSIADVYIFIMLQNKLVGRVKKQKELLDAELSKQYEILDSMAGIYSHVNYIDFVKESVRRVFHNDKSYENLDVRHDPHSGLNKRLYDGMEDELKEKFWRFTDLSTLNERMANEKIITAEFCHKEEGWFRASYIRIGDSVSGPIEQVIYAIRNIDEEKKNVEKWIRKSNTDELTGFYNRHAYEDEISALEKTEIKDNFVYVSIDVNSLKITNDTLGHSAGDELLVGASECMKQCFGSYGKLFRTGGDEFVALIFADDSQLEAIKKDIVEVTENWKGKTNNQLAISCGYVAYKETNGMSLHQMAVLADKRMYEDKTRYYQKKGIDRRGQRDAHVALCALYTKILKVNISEDSYQIINMDINEQSEQMGFADKLSTWLKGFGTSGQVHPEDLDEYLRKTELTYISEYFRTKNKKSLCVFYRRKYADGYKKVIMEMIPANDYTNDSQKLYLYVKSIEE